MNKENEKKRVKEYYQEKKDERLNYAAEYRDMNNDKIKKHRDKYQYKDQLKKKYNLEQYQAMIEEIDGKCPICNIKLVFGGRQKDSACVDHCHKTGKIRGILCCACNLALSKFKDDLQMVESAANYLRRMA